MIVVRKCYPLSAKEFKSNTLVHIAFNIPLALAWVMLPF